MDVMQIRRNLISNLKLIPISGNPLSFNTNLNWLFKELKANFHPNQPGNGDPSPNNIRPIYGFSKGVLTDSNNNYTIFGKNIFNPIWVIDRTAAGLTSAVQSDGSIHISGTASSTNRYIQSSSFMVLPAGTYTASGSPNSIRVRRGTTAIDTNGTFTSDGTTPLNISITFVNGNQYDIYETIQIEEGSTKTSYERFIDVIYGGFVDIINGQLTKTWDIITVNDITWYYNSTYDRFAGTIPKIIETGKARTVPLYCSAFLPISDGRELADTPNNSIYGSGTSNHNIYVQGSGYTTGSAFKTAYSSVEIAYPLRTPEVYQVSSYQINQIIGNNILSTNLNDKIDLYYWVR